MTAPTTQRRRDLRLPRVSTATIPSVEEVDVRTFAQRYAELVLRIASMSEEKAA